MPCDSDVVPVTEVVAIIEALREHLHGTHSHALHCPRAALPDALTLTGSDLLASVGDAVNICVW